MQEADRFAGAKAEAVFGSSSPDIPILQHVSNISVSTLSRTIGLQRSVYTAVYLSVRTRTGSQNFVISLLFDALLHFIWRSSTLFATLDSQ